MFKPLGFVKRMFTPKPKIIHPVPESDLVKLQQVKKPRMPKIKQWGIPVVHTARQCLTCGVANTISRGQIVYTCSDVCRKIQRGGKDNNRLLEKQSKNWEAEGWTKRQLAVWEYRKSIKSISSTVLQRRSITQKESDTADPATTKS